MNKNIQIQNNLGFFPELEKLGVKNFFTFNNEKWGNMRLAQEIKPHSKYQEILKSFKIKNDYIIYMAAHNNDNVQTVTEDNLLLYKYNYAKDFSTADLKMIVIECDAIITKEQIPVVVAPADCSVIVMTAIDKKDNKRFILFIHSGLLGTILTIYEKALEHAHLSFDFQNNDLSGFIYPSISKDYYVKEANKLFHPKLKSSEWSSFLHKKEDKYGIDIEGKIINNLKALGINNIQTTGLDSYEENKKGNLFSLTFLREKKDNQKNRFAVGASL